jgi:ribosomal protein S6E (S10)
VSSGSHRNSTQQALAAQEMAYRNRERQLRQQIEVRPVCIDTAVTVVCRVCCVPQ